MGAMFAFRETKTVDYVEVTDGVEFIITVNLRKLSHKSLTKAAEIRQETNIKSMKNTGAELLKVFKAEGNKVDQEAEKKPKVKKFEDFDDDERKTAFYATYDRPTILRMGIASWSCNNPSYPLPAPETGVDELTSDRADDIFMEIMNMSIPKKVQVKEEESKDSGPSI
jgi:hypothetical protein